MHPGDGHDEHDQQPGAEDALGTAQAADAPAERVGSGLGSRCVHDVGHADAPSNSRALIMAAEAC